MKERLDLTKRIKKMSRLLLLDINGVLCCKYKKHNDQLSESKCDLLELKSYTVILRPGYREFLNFCYENFTVAFFSSTTYHNANAILEKLLTPEHKSKTLFRWFRDRTRLDPHYGINPEIKKHDTIKKLEDVFNCPLINEDRKYGPGNTLLCDDSVQKTRFNEPKNVVIFPKFKGNPNDRVLIKMTKTLLDRFEQL